MTAIHKKIKFSSTATEYFHFNFPYEVHSLFPELDWLMLNYQLNHYSKIHQIELQAFVMLTTHSHLLFQSKHKKENFFTDSFMQALTTPQLKSSTYDQHSSLYKDDIAMVEPIENMAQYLNTYKYIYRNPVEAGLVSRCEKYRFSSLHGLLGQSELVTQIVDPLSVAQDPIKILNWLNNQAEKKLFHFKTLEI